MKISLDWLRDYVAFDLSAEQIGDILSDRGFPIEGIETVGKDTVLDVELTSNRGDCLGHIGIARELAAALGKELMMPEVEVEQSDQDVSEFVDVRIVEPALCGRYTARVITGVTVGPSPQWMRRRLEAVGLRSVNNVVDATNYAMMEHGQPPHAFDYDKVKSKTILVRRAKNGERIVSIDGTVCELNDQMLVIADEHRPIAIAGVMGGLETEVSDNTTTILLEEAHFEPVCIRSTARRLGLNSEASYRFERQVDRENIEWASRRCAQLIVQLAGGKAARGMVDVFPGKREPLTVGMRISRVKQVLGIDVPKDKVMGIFTSLGFLPEGRTEDLVVCTVPSWRHDIYREADLIEEVARCYGYDKIPVEPKIHIEVARPGLKEKTLGKIAAFLNGCGFYETVTVSFIDKRIAELFGDTAAEAHLAVQDVSQKHTNLLRQTLIGPLVSVLQSNANVGNTGCRFFEMADTFIPSDKADLLPCERLRLGLVMEGQFRELRGVIEGLVRRICLADQLIVKPADLKWAQAGARLFIGEKELGIAGLVSPQTAKVFDLERTAVCAAELDVETLLSMAGRIPTAKPIPRFPAIVRDLSLIVDESVRWEQIDSLIRQAAPAELESIEFKGLYRGKPIPNGKKSITLSLRFRDEEGTLRHEIVDGYQQAVVGTLADQLKAELRTA
jgi:phenylalanyl-tRNA synthetase beta chain